MRLCGRVLLNFHDGTLFFPVAVGVYCESDINECISDPCENGALCRQDINSFMCICQPGYTGAYCQVSKDDTRNMTSLWGTVVSKDD